MSEKMTRLELPGQKEFPGIMHHGEKTIAEAIADARSHATHLRKQAEAIERAADADFQVDLVRGMHVPKLIKTLQQAKS